MKKRTLLIMIFAAVLVIAPACANGQETPSDDTMADVPAEESAMAENANGATNPVPEGPCSNILFPLADGNQWVYEVDSIDENGNPVTVEYAWSVAEQSGDTVKLGTLFYESGTVLSADVRCKDGAVENFPLTVSNIVVGDMEGEIEYEFVSGKYLPSYQEIEAGNWENTWQTVVNSSGTITADYEGESVAIVLEESPMIMNWQILEKDVSVTVPAGSFDNAVKINQELIYEINSLTLESSDIPVEISTKMTFDTDYWFVPNIGLVKTQINSTSMDLFGSEFPVEMTGGSVLKSSNLLN